MSQYALGYLLDSEVKEVAIILRDIHPQKVKDYYGDGSKFGCRIEYIEQGKPLGIAHAISVMLVSFSYDYVYKRDMIAIIAVALT